MIELQCNVLFLSGFGVELDIKNERKRVCRGQGQDMGVLMWVGGGLVPGLVGAHVDGDPQVNSF